MLWYYKWSLNYFPWLFIFKNFLQWIWVTCIIRKRNKGFYKDFSVEESLIHSAFSSLLREWGFFPVLLRHIQHISLYTLKGYSKMVWLTYIVNDYYKKLVSISTTISYVCMYLKVAQSCLTPCDPISYRHNKNKKKKVFFLVMRILRVYFPRNFHDGLWTL